MLTTKKKHISETKTIIEQEKIEAMKQQGIMTEEEIIMEQKLRDKQLRKKHSYADDEYFQKKFELEMLFRKEKEEQRARDLK